MQSHLGINRCLLYFGTWELDMTADWRSSILEKYEWVILTLIEHSQALVNTPPPHGRFLQPLHSADLFMKILLTTELMEFLKDIFKGSIEL